MHIFLGKLAIFLLNIFEEYVNEELKQKNDKYWSYLSSSYFTNYSLRKRFYFNELN